MALSGFFKVDFQASFPGDGGIIVLENGNIRGGDKQYLYSGTYSESDGQLSSSIRVKAHSESAESVFGSVGGAFDLQLLGQIQGDMFSLKGASPFPGQQGIHIVGCKVAQIDLR